MYKYYGAPAVAFWKDTLEASYFSAGGAPWKVATAEAKFVKDKRSFSMTPEVLEVMKRQLIEAGAPESEFVLENVQRKDKRIFSLTPEVLEVMKRQLIEAGTPEDEFAIRMVAKLVTCEVCKVQMASQDFRHHETGKKHKMNLENVKGKDKRSFSMTPEVLELMKRQLIEAGAPEGEFVLENVQRKDKRRFSLTPEVLEAMKRQLIEAGTPEDEFAIRKVGKPVTCEVCKMQMTSLSNFRDHETGKKHKKNLKKLQDSILPKPAEPPNGAAGANTAPAAAAAAAVADGMLPSVQPKENKSSPATPEDLEAMERRVIEAGAPEGEFVKKMPKVVQPVTCEVCKMKMASLGNLRHHEKGKKHKKNLEKLQDSITPKPAEPPNGAAGENTSPAAAVADGMLPSVQPKENKSSPATPEDLEAMERRVIEAGAPEGEFVKKMPKVVQPVTCEVCKMKMASLGNLRHHEKGKKHKKNLEKLQDSITPKPAEPPNGAAGENTSPAAAVADGVLPSVQPKENKSSLATPEEPNGADGANTSPATAAVEDGVPPSVHPKENKSSPATPEELEAMKRRLIEAGAPEDELKICTVCSVVAINQMNYELHIAGRKHKIKANVQPPNGAVGASTGPAAAVAADGVMPAVQPMKNKNSAATQEELEAGAAQGELKICTESNVVKEIAKVVKPVTCEVCKIYFNSLGHLRNHQTGRKHNDNLKILQDLITPEPAKPQNDAVGASTEPVAAAAVTDGVIPAVQREKKRKSAATTTSEDLEVKKRRILEAGTDEGELHICRLCNVVTTKQFVYENHMAGLKHKVNLRKLLLEQPEMKSGSAVLV